MNLGLTDRHVVVTGGSGALGSAVVKLLLESGAHCHVPVRGAESLERVESAGHDRVDTAVGIDLADPEAVGAFYEGLPELWASVHCAGGFAMAPIADIAPDHLEGQLADNLRSAIWCCHHAIRRLQRTGQGGRVVNVTARPGMEPRAGAGMSAYTAAKAGVAALTEALAEEVGAEGILVNAVAPAILDTPANREAMPRADFGAWSKVEDAAATIVFLASPLNRSTRGALIPV